MTQPTASPCPVPSPAARRRLLGLPVVALIGLALLTVPRVILHDLGLVSERTGVNALLVFAPAVIWIIVVVAARVRSPFLTLLVTGVISGVFLALTHQLLWNIAFGDSPPQLGGNLAHLDPGVQAVIMRVFATVSSLFTGIVVGAITGLVAWGVSAIIRRPAA